MDVESLAKQLILKGMTDEQQKAVLQSIRNTMGQARELQKQKVGEQAQLVVQALKKIEADIKSRYDEVGNKIEARVASIKDGKDGRDGTNGRDGRAGRDGSTGPMGPKGADGRNGMDGRDGVDGVSVTDARIDFDGSLIISLSSGREINVGEVVAPDLAEKIKVITNGGGTSQSVLDALASLQTQIKPPTARCCRGLMWLVAWITRVLGTPRPTPRRWCPAPARTATTMSCRWMDRPTWTASRTGKRVTGSSSTVPSGRKLTRAGPLQVPTTTSPR